ASPPLGSATPALLCHVGSGPRHPPWRGERQAPVRPRSASRFPGGGAAAATALAPPPGCGRAARRVLLAGSRQSPQLTAARLGAVEVGRAGRGEAPTERRTTRRHGSCPRRARRSPHASPH